MALLVINCGSSSVKAAVFEDRSLARLHDVRVSGIGGPNGRLSINGSVTDLRCSDHPSAMTAVFDGLSGTGFEVTKITAVGHRVLHGGEELVVPTIITDDVEQRIESLECLAPLHNPACLAGIRAARRLLNDCPHVAIFDTAFHATLPVHARLYALPENLNSTFPLRRFGFHGISHEYVSRKAAEALGKDLEDLRLITCHLGNGCSVTAVENGRSVETSMGMTPLEGLVMGSRSGDVDPGIIVQLIRDNDYSADELDTLLNRESGLRGMTGTNNMAEIESRAAAGDESCRRAIDIFTHRVRKYIGAYAAILGGLDAIVFTGGIGQKSAIIRHRVMQRLDFLGATLDEERNRNSVLSPECAAIDLSGATSRVKLLMVATDEEAAIASKVTQKLREHHHP